MKKGATEVFWRATIAQCTLVKSASARPWAVGNPALTWLVLIADVELTSEFAVDGKRISPATDPRATAASWRTMGWTSASLKTPHKAETDAGSCSWPRTYAI